MSNSSKEFENSQNDEMYEEDHSVQDEEELLLNETMTTSQAPAEELLETEEEMKQEYTKVNLSPQSCHLPTKRKLSMKTTAAAPKKPHMGPLQLVAKWERDLVTQQEINHLLGKSSLSIVERNGTITILCTFPQLKTGALIANLVKLSVEKSTSVLQLHVFSVFWSTLLPALFKVIGTK